MKVGILGAGRIAATMAKTLNGMKEAQCYAVASRSLEKAEAFAQKNHVEKAYGSYEEMLSDENVDLVYIATPHSHHLEHGKLCISYGKPVLCEKSFTANAAQARELLDYAAEKKVFITEAIWTRYMPSRKMIDDIIASGELGEIKMISANLGYELTDKERMLRPELAGGALLDVGVYTLNFASMVLGDDIVKMTSECVKTDTGVDGQDAIILGDDVTGTAVSDVIHGILLGVEHIHGGIAQGLDAQDLRGVLALLAALVILAADQGVLNVGIDDEDLKTGRDLDVDLL